MLHFTSERKLDLWNYLAWWIRSVFDSISELDSHATLVTHHCTACCILCHPGLILCMMFSLFSDYLQWEVAEVVLEVFYKLLRDYEPQLEDFVDQYVELQGELVHLFTDRVVTCFAFSSVLWYCLILQASWWKARPRLLRQEDIKKMSTYYRELCCWFSRSSCTLFPTSLALLAGWLFVSALLIWFKSSIWHLNTLVLGLFLWTSLVFI